LSCVVWHPVPQHPGVWHSQPSVFAPTEMLQSDLPELHAPYKHLVPLHAGDPTLVFVLQTLPHAPQFVIVFVAPQSLPTSGGASAGESAGASFGESAGESFAESLGESVAESALSLPPSLPSGLIVPSVASSPLFMSAGASTVTS
jgi:hypothetical protein